MASPSTGPSNPTLQGQSDFWPCQVECLDCGLCSVFSPTVSECPRCHSEWREARYDYATLGAQLPARLGARPFDLWRYAELLPVSRAEAGSAEPSNRLPSSLGEGGTPLYKANNLSLMLGLPHLYIKDERQGPTGSFKDRQAGIVVAALKEAGVTEMVVASTGNVAIAYSAYCARAGIKLWAFVTSLVPAEKMREAALYGTQVVKVSGTYDQAKALAAEFARQRGLYFDRGARGVLQVESMKTLAFEIAEQLGALLGGSAAGSQPMRWQVPDWYVQAVSGGIGPLGALKGFAELRQMGLTDTTPALAAIQTEGCAPMVQAFRAGLDVAPAVHIPQTNIATLSTGDPGRAYTLLRRRTQGTRSVFESVTDEEAFRAMHVLAKLEGVACEPAAAVAVAGLIKLIRAGVVAPDDVVVINCSGHTFPVEKAILGDGWEQNVTAGDGLAVAGAQAARPPQEGLLAALSRLDVRTRSIAIVEDNADARRLLRRILQASGNGRYEIFEAEDGLAALELARRRVPDLILLDLMMPRMDGFAVLDALKADEATAAIPVIVVTAKELTVGDYERLSGRIESVLQKGSFMDEDLFREISERLG